MKKINALDIKEGDGNLSSQEQKQRDYFLVEYWKVAKFNDSLLFQKSRDRWVKDGDSNTKYFHNSVNWRRRTNAIRGLAVDGEWVEDPKVVKSKMIEFFEAQFTSNPEVGVFLEGTPFRSISDEDNLALTQTFNLEEIRTAVWECEGDKSPGPDGYNFHFTKSF